MKSLKTLVSTTILFSLSVSAAHACEPGEKMPVAAMDEKLREQGYKVTYVGSAIPTIFTRYEKPGSFVVTMTDLDGIATCGYTGKTQTPEQHGI